MVETASEGYSRTLARQLVKKWGKWLMQHRPEIANDFLREGEYVTYAEFANRYFLDADKYPEVYEKAVGYAIRRLVDTKTREDIVAKKRRRVLETVSGGFDSEEFREHCRMAALEKVKLGIPAPVEEMVRGRGRTRWTDDEKLDAFKMSRHIDFMLQEGHHIGHPDYPYIAKVLNEKYHGRKGIRYRESVAKMVSELRKKERKNG